MATKNRIVMSFYSFSENVGIARVTAAAFAAQMEFTISEIEEIKVAVSEAVSNAVIHGYGDKVGQIEFAMTLGEDKLEYVITDQGRGIEDIALARQPSYSTDPERMGLGFVFMESFMDQVDIESTAGQGTKVVLIKKLTTNREH
jgi:stage II sporulation protein AB (anti-sigma F factor)